MNYQEYAKIFKALSNPKRLEILDMLSCGELCACKIQEKFDITQPTLSHDMKVLKDAGIIKERLDSRNRYYAIDCDYLDEFLDEFKTLAKEKENCICHR
ncbi:MAG TPA: metalloregulator ArsR/SmtB family transcription factor [Anaerovoracaceae bacterium]|nr:metalloregulator ArsR/SmtB family transcription factor [Anaerovoracaceae bacterium]